MHTPHKPELLSPAGDMEKLKTAIAYGADAVYCGGHQFSLRAGSAGFTDADLVTAIGYAHTHGVKLYVAVNIYAFPHDLNAMRGYFKHLAQAGADAFIVSDPGVFALAREEAPQTDIHISTQANTVNSASVRFWREQGAKRVILSRELSLTDIRDIRAQTPVDTTLEAFVHGAMCVAVSGRCLLSYYMTGRSANRGECAQPCRYRYHLTEEKRPGQYLPVMEDERGLYLFNANDLCMVEHLPAMLAAGIGSLKIEGRMKSVYYVAVTTQIYRRAIDDYCEDPARFEANKPQYVRALQKIAHRGTPGYSTGFYFGPPSPDAQDFAGSSYRSTRVFTGVVRGYDVESALAVVEQRNKFSVGDTIEIIRAGGDCFVQTVRALYDSDGNAIESAPHPKQIVRLPVDKAVAPYDVIGVCTE